MPTEVFGSHSRVDQEFAERLVGVLRRHRIPVWYSDTDIQGAQQTTGIRVAAFTQSRAVADPGLSVAAASRMPSGVAVLEVSFAESP